MSILEGNSIRPFYDGWDKYNVQMVDVIGRLSPDELGIRPAPDGWR